MGSGGLAGLGAQRTGGPRSLLAAAGGPREDRVAAGPEPGLCRRGGAGAGLRGPWPGRRVAAGGGASREPGSCDAAEVEAARAQAGAAGEFRAFPPLPDGGRCLGVLCWG